MLYCQNGVLLPLEALLVGIKILGLYTGAIIMSGQALATWSLELTPREKAYRLAATMGFQGDNDTELAAFLVAANASELTGDLISPLTDVEYRTMSPLAWAPVIEPESDTAIIVESPAAIVKEGRFNQVPLMTGSASADGSQNIMVSGVLTFPARAADLNENFTLLVGSELQLATEQERTEAAQRIEDFYFGEQGFTADQPQQVYDLCSDLYWFEPTEWMVQTVANLSRSPVFYYYFDYNGTASTEYGVPHAGELHYLFLRGYDDPNKDPESSDGKVMQFMLTAWTNFIKFGDPAPGGSPVLWEPYTSDAHNYMDITTEFVQRQDPVKERMDFWEETVPFIVWPANSSASVLRWNIYCVYVALLCIKALQ